jgi:hypothetical protein
VNTDTKLPEFGSNGAVLNSDAMTEQMKQKYLRAEAKSKAWHRWAVFFVPLWIAGIAASVKYGFVTVLPLMMVLLASSLLYQRF